MSLRNSKLILAKNIKLNKNYTEVLSYSESEMLTLLRNNLVNETSEYSFIRPNENTIKAEIPLLVCMRSNYIAFQNPDLSNKWYFAFVDEINYISDSTTEIKYTIDYFSTWFEYWNPKACFVIRQHATNDTIGSNLVDENLELGEYIENGNIIQFNQLLGYVYYVQASGKSDKNAVGVDNVGGKLINGTRVLDDVKRADTQTELKETLDEALNSTRKVLNVWQVPTNLAAARNNNKQIDDTTGVSELTSINVPMVNSLNGYTPANQKLLTFPFIYLNLCNMDGRNNILHYEKFTGTRKLGCDMVLTPGCPGIVYPMNYNGNGANYLEGISTANIPVVPYETDSYKEWLANNTFANKSGAGISALQFGLGAGIGALGVVSGNLGLMSAGAGAISSSVSNAFSMMMSDKQAQLLPPSYFNNNGTGNVLLARGLLQPLCFPMSIRYNTARRIDEFFTRYGYATNKLETPNITHRSNYNYIRVSSDSSPCVINNKNNISIPNKDLEVINGLFRQGITIWHNHANLGDYSVTNTIV